MNAVDRALAEGRIGLDSYRDVLGAFLEDPIGVAEWLARLEAIPELASAPPQRVGDPADPYVALYGETG